MVGKYFFKGVLRMKKNQMCVRTKQIRPGVYKTVSRGYVKALSGHYRVPIGTIIIPDKDAMIVKTKWGSVFWHSDIHNNWWIGCVLPTCFSGNVLNLLDKKRSEEFFDECDIEAILERDGTMWMLQITEQSERIIPKWMSKKILKLMINTNESLKK